MLTERLRALPDHCGTFNSNPQPHIKCAVATAPKAPRDEDLQGEKDLGVLGWTAVMARLVGVTTGYWTLWAFMSIMMIVDNNCANRG
ncbi:hypothetical protein Taro_015389 [Colocasia esculenta]|uniref:Uncharacterized protein n=1 Tax=Colocasia esculenta TaxID=4460 RepID=A0A843UM74_COLES|nr:hypothetical protein [Colocasia esculenta]